MATKRKTKAQIAREKAEAERAKVEAKREREQEKEREKIERERERNEAKGGVEFETDIETPDPSGIQHDDPVPVMFDEPAIDDHEPAFTPTSVHDPEQLHSASHPYGRRDALQDLSEIARHAPRSTLSPAYQRVRAFVAQR